MIRGAAQTAGKVATICETQLPPNDVARKSWRRSSRE